MTYRTFQGREWPDEDLILPQGQHTAGHALGFLLLDCQTAFTIDPRSACRIDPPERHGGGCPGSQ